MISLRIGNLSLHLKGNESWPANFIIYGEGFRDRKELSVSDELVERGERELKIRIKNSDKALGC